MKIVLMPIVAAAIALSTAGCATTPPPQPEVVDLTPPPRKPYDAKTQLESGRIR